MQIRQMTMDDYGAVFGIWSATPGMGMRSMDDSPEGIARYLKRNPDTCFVAVKEGNVIGAILSGHDGRRGYIYHAAVIPARRREGVGKALVDAALAALGRAGILKVALVAFRANEAGNAFWERLGFTERTDLVYRNRSLTERNI